MEAIIIANDLEGAGFNCEVVKNDTIAVSLNYREVNTVELKAALLDIVEIEFYIAKQDNGSVLVTW